MDEVERAYFNKIKHELNCESKSLQRCLNLVLFYMNFIFNAVSLDQVGKLEERIHDCLTLCVPIIMDTWVEGGKNHLKLSIRVLETVKQLSMSDFFDNPLVEFLVQNPKYMTTVL